MNLIFNFLCWVIKIWLMKEDINKEKSILKSRCIIIYAKIGAATIYFDFIDALSNLYISQNFKSIYFKFRCRQICVHIIFHHLPIVWIYMLMVPQNYCCYCRTFWTSDYIKSVFPDSMKVWIDTFFFVMCQKRYRSFPSAIFDLINNIISKIIIDLNCVYILQKYRQLFISWL